MAGEDYVALSSNFTILESDGAQKSFPIEIMDDALFEDEEGFRIHLFSDDPAVKVTSPSSANVFIIDNDGNLCCALCLTILTIVFNR